MPRVPSLSLSLMLSLPSLALAPPAMATSAPQAERFVPAQAAPYFSPEGAQGKAEQADAALEAMLRFRVEDWKGAADGFERYVKRGAKVKHLMQAEFMAAYAESRAGRYEQAAARFDGLVERYPLLRDYHRYYAARALAAAGKYEAALARLAKLEAGSVLEADALLTRADALRSLGRQAEAVRAYREYVERYPGSWREAEARFRLAQALDAADRADGNEATKKAPAKPATTKTTNKSRTNTLGAHWAEARAQYRAVYVRFPTSAFAKDAEARLGAVEPDALKLDGAEHLRRGLALFDAMRNEASEAELQAALDAGDLDAGQTCVAAYHRAQSVFKQRNRPRAAPLFDEAVARCEKAPANDKQAADFHAKSLYQAGRCWASKGDPAAALQRYGRLEREHHDHSYADDARQREAELYADQIDALRQGSAAAPLAADVAPRIAAMLGADSTQTPATTGDALDKLEAERTRLLGGLADAYPDGDQRGSALFRLGFAAFREGRYDEAKQWLDKELAALPREDGWWQAGRTLYWLGRVAAETGHAPEAQAYWVRAAREYPLSYYALQALNRLREQNPEAERKLVAELRKPEASAPEANADLTWSFAPRTVFASAGFRRGLELARLGLGSAAKRELQAVGVKAAGRGDRVDDPRAQELLWVAAVIYDRAREWSLSHSIPRYVLTDYERTWPVGANRKRWLLSYPEGYGELVRENAAKNGQPPALQFAIIREESAFNPFIESFANAVGLTQLIPSSAKRWSQGLPYSREALHDPVINIAIGARELGDGWKRAQGQAALAIAAYNGGAGAVRRWLKAMPAGATLDVYVEAIPYDETRGYTQRVMASYFAYTWLYGEGDPVPVVPPTLPATF